jgi:hypothetical protein
MDPGCFFLFILVRFFKFKRIFQGSFWKVFSVTAGLSGFDQGTNLICFYLPSRTCRYYRS